MDFCRKIILLVTIFSFMSVGWGQTFNENYTRELITISNEELMLINKIDVEGYLYSDTIYISTSILFPPCDDGYTEIDSSCYYQSDLDVLQIFIDNSDSTLNMEMDVDSSGVIEPLELGGQYWSDGRLSYLSCSNCGLTGEIPSEIGNLTNLTSLKLESNQLTGEIPVEIGNLTNLSELHFNHNKLGCYEFDFDGDCGSTNQSECCITDCDEIDECSGEIPSEIGNLTNLTSLKLWDNQFTGEIPVEIGNLTNLSQLSLSNNELTGEIPSEIENLTNLTWLTFGYNSQLSGEIPEFIWSFTNLTYLHFIGCNLTGEIPPDIGNLVNLTNLTLNGNNFTGIIPSEIGNLTNLTTLLLSSNQFSGEIPESLCNIYPNLTGLLYLYSNNFCPPYPECLSENDIGYQDTSECPGEECQMGDYNGYYDCSHTCLTPIYFDYLGDDSCNDSGINFDCYNYGYDCGDCSEDWDGTDPLGFCSCPLVTGDTNEDGLLNVLDIMLVVNCVLSDDCDECSDLNYDGNVDVLDIMIMVNLILEP